MHRERLDLSNVSIFAASGCLCEEFAKGSLSKVKFDLFTGLQRHIYDALWEGGRRVSRVPPVEDSLEASWRAEELPLGLGDADFEVRCAKLALKLLLAEQLLFIF